MFTRGNFCFGNTLWSQTRPQQLLCSEASDASNIKLTECEEVCSGPLEILKGQKDLPHFQLNYGHFEFEIKRLRVLCLFCAWVSVTSTWYKCIWASAIMCVRVWVLHALPCANHSRPCACVHGCTQAWECEGTTPTQVKELHELVTIDMILFWIYTYI